MNFLSGAVLIVGAWAIINGILHDIFVLRSEHGKVYDRNLLRLLMDGHILITCGAVQMLAYSGIEEHANWAYYMAGVASLSLVIYCAMIWPFLKSVVTTVINVALLVLLVIGYLSK
ncbi:MAG TPA: hypothetical protein VNY36_09335 [Bacteroidia bacterium]|jgi:hypothetical protein|nr:hypothetical protein [Bacteroidia bacterium]